MNLLQPHPLSKIPPPLTPEEYSSLEQSILKNGKIDDVTTYEGMILDGNHGYRHCIKHGIPFKIKEFVPNGVATAQDFVLAKLEGRHLNFGQRVCVAALMAKATKKDKHAKYDPANKGDTIDKVSKLMKVGTNVMAKAGVLLNNCKDLFNKVYSGKCSVEAAYAEYRRATGSAIKPTKETSVNLDAFKTAIKIPSCFCYDSEMSAFIKTMNAHGWTLEVRYQDGKVYAHWYGNGYPTLGNAWVKIKPEFDFKRAAIVAANDKKDKLK